MKRFLLITGLLVCGFMFSGSTNDSELELLKQQNSLLQEQIDQQKNTLEETKQKEQINSDTNQNLDNDLKCKTLLNDLKKQYDNVISVYYNINAKTCYAKFLDRNNNDNITESPVNDMQPIKLSENQIKEKECLGHMNEIKKRLGTTYNNEIKALFYSSKLDACLYGGWMKIDTVGRFMHYYSDSDLTMGNLFICSNDSTCAEKFKAKVDSLK